MLWCGFSQAYAEKIDSVKKKKKQKIIDCLYLSMIYLSHMLIPEITNGLKLGEKSGPNPNITYINEYAH
jgi:hypothetical protein